jgi:hypothetical protein
VHPRPSEYLVARAPDRDDAGAEQQQQRTCSAPRVPGGAAGDRSATLKSHLLHDQFLLAIQGEGSSRLAGPTLSAPSLQQREEQNADMFLLFPWRSAAGDAHNRLGAAKELDKSL